MICIPKPVLTRPGLTQYLKKAIFESMTFQFLKNYSRIDFSSIKSSSQFPCEENISQFGLIVSLAGAILARILSVIWIVPTDGTIFVPCRGQGNDSGIWCSPKKRTSLCERSHFSITPNFPAFLCFLNHR